MRTIRLDSPTDVFAATGFDSTGTLAIGMADAMELEELRNLMDEEGIGDPAIVELLDEEIPEFKEALRHEEKEDPSMAYIAATASLFQESVDAFELLVRMRGVVDKQATGGWSKFYDDQQSVWRRRKNKSQHDLQYLRIVLGMRQSPQREDELRAEDMHEPQQS